MATSRLDITSDEIINIKCCVCLSKNRTREADRYCVECKDYYCSPCSEEHKNFPALRSHKLLDKADFKSQGSDGSLPSFVTQRCAQHQSEVVNMFCKDHNDVVCATCVALNHRSCTKIHYIPEDVDNLYNKTDLTNMKQKINKTKKTMEDIKAAKENEVKELEEVFNKEVESVKTFRKELESLLFNIEQETISKLKQEYDRIESRLISDIKEVNKIIDDINELSSQLKKSEGNSTQEFVSIKSSEKVTTKAQNVERENQKKTEETISFSAEEKIQTFLQQIQTFGTVSSIEKCTTGKNDKLYKVKIRREINVKLAKDTLDCDIECCCLTEEGCLLLTDYKNNKLKRLDMSTETLKDYLDFKARPNAVCVVSKTEGAVTLNNETVQFVSLGNKLTASRSLKINHNCYGLVHHNGKLIISDGGKNVYIHDMNGRELQRVSTDTAGKEIFQDNRHLTISAGGDGVFVADCDKGVIILDIQGNYLSTLTDPTLSGCQEVCTDGRHLFVCGYSSGRIVQIGQDYQVLGELGKIYRPQSLCFDGNMNRLIVTNNGNNITVFELE